MVCGDPAERAAEQCGSHERVPSTGRQPCHGACCLPRTRRQRRSPCSASSHLNWRQGPACHEQGVTTRGIDQNSIVHWIRRLGPRLGLTRSRADTLCQPRRPARARPHPAQLQPNPVPQSGHSLPLDPLLHRGTRASLRGAGGLLVQLIPTHNSLVAAARTAEEWRAGQLGRCRTAALRPGAAARALSRPLKGRVLHPRSPCTQTAVQTKAVSGASRSLVPRGTAPLWRLCRGPRASSVPRCKWC